MAEAAADTRRSKETEREIAWTPQPRQELALRAPAKEVFYGGAAGGGKSDWLLMDFLREADRWGNHHRGVIFRRTYPELEELLLRAKELYPLLGATYAKTEKTWHFPAGSTLKFRYIENEDDVHNYQGHQYTWIGWDELTNWPTSYPYIYMLSRLRSPSGAPTAMRAAGNPGGVGHVWVKERFIDPAPPETLFYTKRGTSCVFIPAKLEDNRILMENDPEYELNLEELRDTRPELYQALREGDWNVFAGQVFQEFRTDTHVIKPFQLDPAWKKFVSMDWGYTKPFSLGWWAVTGDGRLIRYKEWYGCEDGKRDTGLKLSASEVAEKAWEMSIADGATDMVADPASWKAEGLGNTIAGIFEGAGFQMEKGINDRVSGLQRMHDLMHMRGHDGRPMLLVFNNCRGFIRTIPQLVYSDKDPEDVDTTMEDHPYDEARYAIMSPMSKMTSQQSEYDYDDFNLPYPNSGEYDPFDW